MTRLGKLWEEEDDFDGTRVDYPKPLKLDKPAALQQAEDLQTEMWAVIEEVSARNGGTATLLETSPVGFAFLVEVPIGGKLVATYPHTDLAPLVSNLRQRFLVQFTNTRIEELAYRVVGSSPGDLRAQCYLRVLYRGVGPFDNPQQDEQLRTYDNRTTDG